MITVISYSSEETSELQETKYQQFLNYYHTTNLRIEEIFKEIGLSNNRNSTGRYIRKRLREEGYNSLKRARSISKGEWV